MSLQNVKFLCKLARQTNKEIAKEFHEQIKCKRDDPRELRKT